MLLHFCHDDHYRMGQRNFFWTADKNVLGFSLVFEVRVFILIKKSSASPNIYYLFKYHFSTYTILEF